MAGFLSHKFTPSTFTSEAEYVFSKENLPINTTDINSGFRELNKTYKQYLRSVWEVASLDTYIKQRLVYRGMRINIIPN